jgi:chromosome segregation ATPase
MSEAVLIAVIGVLGTALGALATLFVQQRRLPSEVKLTEAQAKKAEREADDLLFGNLTDEIERLKGRITDLEARLTKSEGRATSAEVRLADSEARANEFRRAVIVVGERLDAERTKNRKTIEKLMVIIEHLLSCIEEPSKAKDVDQVAIARLIQTIRNGYTDDVLAMQQEMNGRQFGNA